MTRRPLRCICPVYVHAKKEESEKPAPPLTFQLFIYESLITRFHNQIKRTRDVVNSCS